MVNGPVLRDFEAYWAAAVTWANGDDPYSRAIWRAERTVPGVVATREEVLPFVNPPFSLLLWSGFARFDYATAAMLWRILLGLAFITLTLGALELVGERVDWLERAAVAILGAAFGPLTSGLALGQVAVVAVAAAAATLFVLRERTTLAEPGAATETSTGLVAAATALIAALQPNVGIVLASRLGERRATIALVLAGFVAIAGSIAAMRSLAGFFGYLAVVRQHRAAELFLAIQTTPTAIARAFGAAPPAAQLFGAVLALVVAVTVVVQWLQRGGHPLRRFALVSAAWPLTWTFGHEHDFTLALFPAIFALRRTDGIRWLAAAFGTMLVAVDWLGLAQRPNGLAQSALLALAAILAIVVIGDQRRRSVPYISTLFPLATIVVLVLALGSVSHLHQLPIWPNALPEVFNVPHGASIANTWLFEQHLAGTDRLDPWWGLLRALSLLGCGLLWWAVTRGGAASLIGTASIRHP